MTWAVIVAILAATIGYARHGTLVQQAPPEAAAVVNPYEGSDDARMAGEKLFHHDCAYCHGANAHGNATAPPLDRPDIRAAAPGALFWVLKNGSLRGGMPSFAHLPAAQRWQIITFIRSLGSGTVDKHGK